ncbi:CYH1 protein, partial [Upupa epops]|nr:CYH1 protein [Upupa epops]
QRLKDEIAEVTNEIENLGSTEERAGGSRQGRGQQQAPLAPLQGIQFLIENDLLKNTCEDIAQFLYKGEGLNKTAIGDYLGERDEFNIQVLHAFVELHEFTDLNLVQALRQFLWSFRLPGEAQKIDRMMEAFAQRYCQCNP